MKYTEINIKQDMPLVADAMRFLQERITQFKRDKYDVVLVIHGYGSAGMGGAICEKARQWLKAQKEARKLKSVVFGEDFSIFNFESLELKNRYHELANLMNVCNHGVTVVEF